MIKKLIVLSAALVVTACNTVTNEIVKVEPFEYNINASKNELYFAAVDCSLENISASTTSGGFFNYQNEEAGRLSVAFETRYNAALSSIPIKSTMSVRVEDNKLNLIFSNLKMYSEYNGWASLYRRSDGSLSGAEIKLKETADSLSNCIRERA